MQEENKEQKPQKGASFYTYRGGTASAPGADAAREGAGGGRAEAGDGAAQPQLPEAYLKEFPEPTERQKRSRTLKSALVTFAAAAAVCALAFAGAGLGLFGSAGFSLSAPQGAGGQAGADSLSFASIYLNSIPWDRKSHDSLKSLEKMKNLEYALGFFEKYSQADIAALPERQTSIGGTVTNYKEYAGQVVTIEAGVTQKYAVAEAVGPDPGAPSALLSLDSGIPDTGASLLVVGSSMDGVNVNDTIRCVCLPVYLYTPKDPAAGGGIIFITLPGLVQGVE